FSGARQGLAVWIWAIAIAILVAIIAAIAGSKFNILGNLNGFPRIPIDEGTLTATGIITAIAVVVISLIGAILGGLAGMRYHRQADEAGLGRSPSPHPREIRTSRLIASSYINSVFDSKVVDQNEAKDGTVKQVFVDDESGHPLFVSAATGLFGMSESFVPLQR